MTKLEVPVSPHESDTNKPASELSDPFTGPKGKINRMGTSQEQMIHLIYQRLGEIGNILISIEGKL